MACCVPRTLTLAPSASLFLSACATTPHSFPRKSEPAVAPHVDLKAQRLYYDEGLQYYARENYEAAQESPSRRS